MKWRIKGAEVIFVGIGVNGSHNPFPPLPHSKQGSSAFAEKWAWLGWRGCFQGALCSTKTPREKLAFFPAAWGLPRSPSTEEAGTTCYRMTKENGRTLSTVWGAGEQGAAVMEDLGIGSRQWLTLRNHLPPARTAPLNKWKACLQDWSVKENIKRTN